MRGLRAMASDLLAGPLEGRSELVFLWGERRRTAATIDSGGG